jgi:hypothetical protein
MLDGMPDEVFLNRIVFVAINISCRCYSRPIDCPLPVLELGG